MDLIRKKDELAIVSFILGVAITLLWALYWGFRQEIPYGPPYGRLFREIPLCLIVVSFISLFSGIVAVLRVLIVSRMDPSETECRGLFLAIAGIILSGINILSIAFGWANLFFTL